MDVSEEDIYEILDVPSSATVQEIKKAYRKKALTCHPDKNPDNPRAAELFLRLSKALEILIDEKARAAYDKVYNAKKAALVRHQELDSKRKKLKEDLEERERKYQKEVASRRDCTKKSEEARLASEINRLRKEGSKQLQEELEALRREILTENISVASQVSLDPTLYRLKAKWALEESSSVDYSKESLTKIFSKYGDIAAISTVNKKKYGSALIEFEEASSAIKAYKMERGFPNNPLSLSWLTDSNKGKGIPKNADFGTCNSNSTSKTSLGEKRQGLFPSMQSTTEAGSRFSMKNRSTPSNDVFSSEIDFEEQVLQRMREVEQNKRTQAASSGDCDR